MKSSEQCRIWLISQLNARTPRWLPVPHINHFTQQLCGTKIYFKIKPLRAYIAEENVLKTAITTTLGLFEFSFIASKVH